jgi:hypothetical protein
MVKFTITCALLISLFSYGAFAAPIDGAFGLRLGDRLDLDAPNVIKVAGIVNEVYRVTPPKPLDGFDEYFVFVTPLTYKIFRIRAISQYADLEDAHLDFRHLREVLSAKYAVDSVDSKTNKQPTVTVDENGKEQTYESNGNTVNISVLNGRDFNPLSRPGDLFVYYPRIAITYYSKKDDLTVIENERINRLRNENDGERYRRKRNARSVL